MYCKYICLQQHVFASHQIIYAVHTVVCLFIQQEGWSQPFNAFFTMANEKCVIWHYICWNVLLQQTSRLYFLHFLFEEIYVANGMSVAYPRIMLITHISILRHYSPEIRILLQPNCFPKHVEWQVNIQSDLLVALNK